MKIANQHTLDEAEVEYKKARVAYWEEVACKADFSEGWGGYYHRVLERSYRFWIPPGRKVLELGCGQGDLLASVKPGLGVGIDFSPAMVERAAKRYPDLKFLHEDAHDLQSKERFDYIILSDLVNDLWDVQTVFQRLAQVSHQGTRLILNSYSRLWEIPLGITKALGLGKPVLQQNWLTVEDLNSLLELSDFEVIRHWPEIMWPLPTPGLDPFFNRFLVKIWPFCHLGLTNFIVARPWSEKLPFDKKPRVSVIIPARNEAGNIQALFERMPALGTETEMIFVEGHSKDGTYEAIEKCLTEYPQRKAVICKQEGKGKGDAVRMGFQRATGDILMILDADLTVPAEDLRRFYEALVSGKGELINGVRLVYPMEKQAMRFLNLAANKFFGLAFSWTLGQSIRDTLCGTKVLWKSDYELIAANRSYFGDFDPFGDFDLLFGASKLNLKILDLPVRYRERVYGTTNIQRWRHGILLIKMLVLAAIKMKFK